MSVEQAEAGLTSAAREERQLIGPNAVKLGRTVSVDRVRVQSGGAVVDIEIPTVDTVDHAKLGRPVDKRYQQSKNMVMTRLKMTGWASACVISCLPIELRSDSTMEPLRKARVPAVRDAEDLSSLTFLNPHLEHAQIGPDAPLACYDFQPIQLATEFQRVFESHGGVFAFIGSPEDVKNPAWPHHAAWKAIKERAVKWMQQMEREAQSFADQKSYFSIRETHRACIRRLHAIGHTKTLPDFLEKKNDAAVEYPTCPKCQKRAESPHALECLHCHWILDPRGAFENNIIDESSTHLERLTRAIVTEMGISAYVAETIDEKPDRLAAGLPKPKSEAAMRLIEQDEEFKDRERKQSARDLGEALANAQAPKKGKEKD